MINPLFTNIAKGLNLALGRKCSATDFQPSWHTIVFCFLLFAGIACVFDMIAVESPRFFWPLGIKDEFIYFALLFGTAYAAGLCFKNTDKTLLIATMLYNVLLLPEFAFSCLYSLGSDFVHRDEVYQHVSILQRVWIFLITFRTFVLVFEDKPLRHILSALIIIAALFYYPPYFRSDQLWYSEDVYTEEEVSPLSQITHETLFYQQRQLLQEKLDALSEPVNEKADLYGIVFGSFGEQDVFMHEAEFVTETLSAFDDMEKRILTLINNKNTIDKTPLASVSNLKDVLLYLGKKMQAEDAILLYLTSHGGQDGTLSVSLSYNHSFNQLTPKVLSEILKESGIKNKIIISSACYSGAAIDTLKDDNTLIITAAAKDRVSYGCSDTSKLTYFADAYFKKALPVEKDWVQAFTVAKGNLTYREAQEGLPQHSNPHIYIGKDIAPRLPTYLPKKWSKGGVMNGHYEFLKKTECSSGH